MAEEKGEVRGKTGQKAEAEKRGKLNPEGVMVRVGSETFLFRPKPRSVFPKRGRLVKTMILDSILRFLCFSSSSSEPQDAEDPVHDGFFNMGSPPKATNK